MVVGLSRNKDGNPLFHPSFSFSFFPFHPVSLFRETGEEGKSIERLRRSRIDR